MGRNRRAERKILVVDDEHIILNILDDAYNKVGYSVFLATKLLLISGRSDRFAKAKKSADDASTQNYPGRTA